jgi:hypothetical protein
MRLVTVWDVIEMANRAAESAWLRDVGSYRRRLRAMLRLASALDMQHPIRPDAARSQPPLHHPPVKK